MKNSAFHFYNDDNPLIDKGTILLIRPYENHYLKNSNQNDCRIVNISIHPSLMIKMLDYLEIDCIKDKILNTTENIFTSISPHETLYFERRLFKLATQKDENLFAGLKLISSELLMLFSTGRKMIYDEPLPTWFENVLNEFQNKHLFSIGISQLYLLSQKSPEHLCRTFKKYLGISPTEYVNNLRLEHAIVLLLSSDYQILEIALECGFDNLSHFYHIFKKKNNLTPNKYRMILNKTISSG